MITLDIEGGLHSGSRQRLHESEALRHATYQLVTGPLTYGVVVEDIDDTCVKIGAWTMGHGKQVFIYGGTRPEMLLLVRVCYWFYKTTGMATNDLKDKLRREERAHVLPPSHTTSYRYRPPHGGFPGEPEMALVA
jgi:hypothetical protein